MESSVVRTRRLREKNKWVYSAHSRFSLQVEKDLETKCFEVKPFGSLVEQIADGLHGVRHYVDDGIVMLAVGNVTEFGLDLSTKKMVTADEHERLKRSQVQRGDLLVTITGRLGTALVYESNDPANLSAHVARVRVKPDAANPHYLAAYLNSQVGKQLVDEFSIGSLYPHINVNRLQNVRVILPPRPIQDRIAQVMQDAYATRREKLAEAKALIEGIDQFLVESLGIDFRDISREKSFLVRVNRLIGSRFAVDFYLPQIDDQYRALKKAQNCKVIPLDQLIRQIANGATPKGAKYQAEGIPFFRIQNIKVDGIDLSDIRYITSSTHDEMQRSQTKPGDILMTITGRVGTAAIVPETIAEGNINQHIVILRLKPGAIDPNYLVAIINSSIVAFQAEHRTTGTTRIALDYAAIKSILIPVPSPEMQKRLVEAISTRRTQAKRLRSEAEAVVAEAKARVERMILGQEEVP